MNELTLDRLNPGDLTQFEPEKTSFMVDALQAVAKRAAQMDDWEAAHEAIRQMIQWQREHVAWWDAGPAKRHGLNRHNLESQGRGTLSMADAEAQTGIRNQQISRWRKSLDDPRAYEEAIFRPLHRHAMTGKGGEGNHRAQGSGENEWYTPEEYIEHARTVMGVIDLDPATSEQAQKTIKATTYFTKDDDGLEQTWHGSVWLNPPYRQGEIGPFVDKLVSEQKNIKQAIMLVHAYTDTAWFHTAAHACQAICFTRGRIAFYNTKGEEACPTQGQAFFYFGPNRAKFAAVFTKVGFVLAAR